MIIDRVEIENYRSIRHLDLRLGPLNALVGPNNSGKTNVLAALELVLGSRWPSRNSLELSDWHNQDQNADISIQIYFHPNPHDVASIRFTCPGSAADKAEARMWFKTNPYGNGYFLSNEVRERCALVYVDANRSYDAQLGSSKWSLFGRIIRELDDNFRSVVGQEAQKELEAHLGRAQNLLQTELYKTFETAVRESFLEQLRHTSHDIRLEFRTFDPLSFYRSLHPVLSEEGSDKSPAESGSGMRNLIVLALFRAYAKAFRGQAVIALEEPEIYLHPHAQRSLYRLFQEMAANGSQLLYSTHSPSFVDIARSDEVVLVERCGVQGRKPETHIRQYRYQDLVRTRQARHSRIAMTEASVRARLSNICGRTHAEAYFARGILLVEGPTEVEAMETFARGAGIDFDGLNISVVPAGGKTNLDALFDLYRMHEIPVFVMFDNDEGGESRDQAHNLVLSQMLWGVEEPLPSPEIQPTYAVLKRDFEATLQREVDAVQPGLYRQLRDTAALELGSTAGKPLVARWLAQRLVEQGSIPSTFRTVAERVRDLAQLPRSSAPHTVAKPRAPLDDDIPF